MDIRVLNYFLTIAREESITKAAEVLHMTQPPLSRQIKELEEELGKQLLIRGGKRITLTEDGLLLKKRAEEMVLLYEKTVSEMTTSNDQLAGDIYIGAGESEGVSIIAEYAKRLQKNFPLIKFHLRSGDGVQIAEHLDSGIVDFGLFLGGVDTSKYDSIKLPYNDTWGVLMQKKSPLAKKDNIKLKDIKNLPVIVSQQTLASGALNTWFKGNINDLNIVASYDLIYNASRFVKSGFGYAIALDNIINTKGDSGLVFKPLSPKVKIDMYIAWKRYQVFSKASGEFLKLIRDDNNT